MQNSKSASVEQNSVSVASAPLDAPRVARWPYLPLLASFALAAFTLFPPVRDNTRMVWAFGATAAFLIAWQGALWLFARRQSNAHCIEFAPPLKAHYIQATVQFCIYAYWGWYWPNVYAAVPLFAAQILFLYTFDALLAWTRGRVWRLGCGGLPIVFSTNLFLWFKDDWFHFQFAMLALAVLGKEFLRWNRDGKNTHIFNPSAFGLAVVSFVLIATNSTRLTWGIEVATTIARPPHIYLEIFLLGLVVQYFFSVTLMTVSAVVSLWLLNAIYTWSTGVYYFVDTNIPIAIFLGMHLLMTDPATSPRSNAGKVVFGTAYGVANFVLFFVLGRFGVPDFYDKLLPVPILNLCVPAIDRAMRNGWLARWMSWERALTPRRLNLVYMSSWAAFFVFLLGTGQVDAPHEGSSIGFWKRAYDEGKPEAGRNLVKMVGSMADANHPSANNQLGLIYTEGKMTAADRPAAAFYFARACELENPRGCENVLWQFLTHGEAASQQALKVAFERVEARAEKAKDGRGCTLLGLAYEVGSGRPQDLERALALFRLGVARGHLDAAKGRVRLSSHAPLAADEFRLVEQILDLGRASSDAQSALYLAHVYLGGDGIAADEQRADLLLEEACRLGAVEACNSRLTSGGAPQLARSIPGM